MYLKYLNFSKVQVSRLLNKLIIHIDRTIQNQFQSNCTHETTKIFDRTFNLILIIWMANFEAIEDCLLHHLHFIHK